MIKHHIRSQEEIQHDGLRQPEPVSPSPCDIFNHMKWVLKQVQNDVFKYFVDRLFFVNCYVDSKVFFTFRKIFEHGNKGTFQPRQMD